MTLKINMTPFAGQRLLIAPLDWGLGHATRCIPLIRALEAHGSQLWLAGEGAQEVLLRKEFPHLPFLPLKGYHIRYATRRVAPAIISQIPKISRAVSYENKWLKQQMKTFRFDAVISDNRYGLYHPGAHSVFITHQLQIKSPLGKWSEGFLQKINYRLIRHFDECWVPDEAEENNLAGELSHPVKPPYIPVKYIGWLSRFEKTGIAAEKDRILIVLSGPEPQRTILEKKITEGLSDPAVNIILVRGLPQEKEIPVYNQKIKIYNHLSSGEMQLEMEKAEWVIGRSGYSSIMDLARLQKKSILVPTPGQSEQEYLAAYLAEKKLAFAVRQEKISFAHSLEQARQSGFHFFT